MTNFRDDSVLKQKGLDVYPVEFRLYSVEYAKTVDTDLVCSICLKKSDAKLVKETNITLINTITYVEGSESEILLPVPAIGYIADNFTDDLFKENVDKSCALCSYEKAEPVNIYQLIDYALYAHNSCMKELSDEFSEFCRDCPKIVSRHI